MKKAIFWTPLALRDLVEIRDFIQRDKPSAAKQEAKRIQKIVERLSQFPESGRRVETIPMVREVVAGNYHVYYCIRPLQVEILRVYHGKRSGLFLKILIPRIGHQNLAARRRVTHETAAMIAAGARTSFILI